MDSGLCRGDGPRMGLAAFEARPSNRYSGLTCQGASFCGLFSHEGQLCPKGGWLSFCERSHSDKLGYQM
jgi:hypothetical protein